MGGGAMPDDLAEITSEPVKSCSPYKHPEHAPLAEFITQFNSGYGDSFSAVCATCLLDGNSDEPFGFFDGTHWRIDSDTIGYVGRYVSVPWPGELVRPCDAQEPVLRWQAALLAALPGQVEPSRVIADDQLADRMWTQVRSALPAERSTYNPLSKHHAWARWLVNPQASAQDVLMPVSVGRTDWRAPVRPGSAASAARHRRSRPLYG